MIEQFPENKGKLVSPEFVDGVVEAYNQTLDSLAANANGS
jgi:hypothetical protein